MSDYPHIELLGKNNLPLPMDKLRSRDAEFCELLETTFRFQHDGTFPPGGQRIDAAIAQRLELLLQLIDDDLAFPQKKYEEEQQADLDRQAAAIRGRNAARERLEWFARERGLADTKA